MQTTNKIQTREPHAEQSDTRSFQLSFPFTQRFPLCANSKSAASHGHAEVKMINSCTSHTYSNKRIFWILHFAQKRSGPQAPIFCTSYRQARNENNRFQVLHADKTNTRNLKSLKCTQKCKTPNANYKFVTFAQNSQKKNFPICKICTYLKQEDPKALITDLKSVTILQTDYVLENLSHLPEKAEGEH